MNKINDFDSVLSWQSLPEYVFTGKFIYHYLFTDLLLTNYCESEFVKDLFKQLLVNSNERHLVISQIDATKRELKETTLISINDFSLFKATLNGNFSDKPGCINFMLPCNTPIVIYDNSYDWCFYYLYESELVILASISEVMLSAMLLENCFLGSLKECFEYVGGKDHIMGEFQKKMIKNYGSLIQK